MLPAFGLSRYTNPVDLRQKLLILSCGLRQFVGKHRLHHSFFHASILPAIAILCQPWAVLP